MPPSKRPGKWRQRKDGTWTLTLGPRGMSVRLFQKRVGGIFYRRVWLQGDRQYDTASLKTRDRAEAEHSGRVLLGALITGTVPERAAAITLMDLWSRFSRYCEAYRQAKPVTRRDYASRVQNLMGFFGTECHVDGLTADDVRAYEVKRRAGGIVRPDGRSTVPVRARSTDADLAVLNIMLRWATTVRRPDGKRWLQDNPLTGVRRKREQNPRRPVASLDRYLQTREATRTMADAAPSETERMRWTRMELALVLAKETGRRLSSIRNLLWDDIDCNDGSIRWRAEFDKKGHESVIPIPDELVEEIRQFRRRLGALSGWVFARESDGAEPMDRHLFDKWLTVAEQHAGLEKLKGGLWHPYRRMWATARSHLPLKQVAVAGGWKDTETLLTCYQHPDRDSLLNVMRDERPLREANIVR